MTSTMTLDDNSLVAVITPSSGVRFGFSVITPKRLIPPAWDNGSASYLDENFLAIHNKVYGKAFLKPAEPKWSTGNSLLRFAGAWHGDDLDECIRKVYKTRGKTKF